MFISQGSGSVGLFQTADNAGSGWTKLTTVTASTSSSLTITSVMSSTYTNYALVFDNVVLSTSAILGFQISSDNGSTYKSSGYLSGLLSTNYIQQHLVITTILTIFISGGGSTYESSGCVYLCNSNNANYPCVSGNSIAFDHSTNCFAYYVSGGYSPTILINAIKILSSSGTMTTGDFTLFGWKK